MSNLAEAILSAAQSLPEGGLISPKEFLHLASRAAVDQAFTRLAREEKLLRLGRGIYSVPVHSKYGTRPPSTQAVIGAIQSASGEIVVSNGAVEANELGLTTQVPTMEIFLTSGPSRKIQLGKRKIELRHGLRWQLAMGNRLAGKAVRALYWIGSEHASEALVTLQRKLPTAEWDAVLSSRSLLPSWMAKAVSEAANV